MTYTYCCGECNTQWEDRYSINDRDIPTQNECPHCKFNGNVKRIIDFAPRISYSGAKTVLQRAGSGWNDVLTKIKKGSGKKAKIETR